MREVQPVHRRTSKESVSKLVSEIVPQDASRIEAARAIQKYLRSDGGFSYSLKLPKTDATITGTETGGGRLAHPRRRGTPRRA